MLTSRDLPTLPPSRSNLPAERASRAVGRSPQQGLIEFAVPVLIGWPCLAGSWGKSEIGLSILFAVFLLLTPAIGQTAVTTNAVVAAHFKDLVVLQEDRLVPIKSLQSLQAPYTVLYFGAGWCPDCRRFSPALAAAYGRQSPQRRQFEVLFVTKDKSEQDMLKFMRAEKMHWPALAFDKVAGAKDLARYYSGHGIPCLSVIDPKGTIVLQSKTDQDAIEVLQQLERLTRRDQ